MKKIALFLTLILVFVLALTSCGINRKLNVEQTPPDYSVIVKFATSRNILGYTWFTPSHWNDIEIFDKIYGKGMWTSSDTVQLTIPAGDSKFIFDAYYCIEGANSSTTYRVRDVALHYDMEVGKKYEIKGRFRLLGLIEGSEFFIELYDITKGRELLVERSLGKSRDFR